MAKKVRKSLKQVKNRRVLKKAIGALTKKERDYKIRGFVKQNGLDK